MQAGTYAAMVDNATRLLDGHLQLQRRGYLDDPRIENAIDGVSEQIRKVRNVPGVVTATPRIAAFVLISGNDRSYGAQLLGVDPVGELALSSLPTLLAEGRYLNHGAEAYVGQILARNLGVSVGDQIVVLGTATRTAEWLRSRVTLVGTFDVRHRGVLDRQLLEVPYAPVAAEAFAMHDAAHVDRRAGRIGCPRAAGVARGAAQRPAGGSRRCSNGRRCCRSYSSGDHARPCGRRDVMFGILAAVVRRSAWSTAFLMTVFERTREFGMLVWRSACAPAFRDRGAAAGGSVPDAVVPGLAPPEWPVGVPLVLVGRPRRHSGGRLRARRCSAFHHCRTVCIRR